MTGRSTRVPDCFSNSSRPRRDSRDRDGLCARSDQPPDARRHCGDRPPTSDGLRSDFEPTGWKTRDSPGRRWAFARPTPMPSRSLGPGARAGPRRLHPRVEGHENEPHRGGQESSEGAPSAAPGRFRPPKPMIAYVVGMIEPIRPTPPVSGTFPPPRAPRRLPAAPLMRTSVSASTRSTPTLAQRFADRLGLLGLSGRVYESVPTSDDEDRCEQRTAILRESAIGPFLPHGDGLSLQNRGAPRHARLSPGSLVARDDQPGQSRVGLSTLS